MFDSSDVQSVFSGNIAEEWEKKSRYINSLNGNDNMMIPTIKKYITSTSKILEVGCGTGKLLSQIDALTFGIELTGVEMSSDMLQQIDTLRCNYSAPRLGYINFWSKQRKYNFCFIIALLRKVDNFSM